MVLFALLPDPALPQDRRQRTGVMIVAKDVFSGRAASLIGHLAAEFVGRQSGLHLVRPEEVAACGEVLPDAARLAAAQAQLQEGLDSYENLELQEAAGKLKSASAELEGMPTEVVADRGRSYVTALTYLGASELLTGDQAGAREAFRRLFVFDRDAKLDPSLFPPRIAAQVEAVRREVAQGPTGSLSVVSVPAHGQVYVDAVFRCVAPCTVESLPPGAHMVVVRRVGYQACSTFAAVEEGGEQTARCQMVAFTQDKELARATREAAEKLDAEGDLGGDLLRISQKSRLDQLLLGQLVQQGEGVGYQLGLYSVKTGSAVRFHQGTLQEGSEGFDPAVEGVLDYLINGRDGGLAPSVAGADKQPFRLKDEELFETSSSPIYHRWYFWTAVGGGVAVVAVVLAVVLLKGEEPTSQILIEF